MKCKFIIYTVSLAALACAAVAQTIAPVITTTVVGEDTAAVAGPLKPDAKAGLSQSNDAVVIPPVFSGEQTDSVWNAANAAYIKGDYATAVNLYSQLLSSGRHSARLYYNLGNAYFKQNLLGSAILNYNRAQMLAPADADIDYNLKLANTRIVDKIDTVPEFFLKTWLRYLALMLSSNTWAVLAVVFLVIGLAAIILWLLSGTLLLRKLGFYGGVGFIMLFLLSLGFSTWQRSRQLSGDEAIVMNLMAPVKSSPSAGSKDLFVLHEGTKVRITESMDGWKEIVLSDGNKGWIESSAIEAINLNGMLTQE